MSQDITPFEAIRRTNPAGNEFWSSRDFARVLGYVNYRHFLAVIEKARTACFNSGQRVEDHFVGIDEMVDIGSGAQRAIPTVMSRYGCYLVIQNANPTKEIVALGQTYFAIQTRRQELSDEEVETQRRLTIRSELRQHNSQLADAAKDAGVVEPRDYAIFQNHGYMGLYHGLGAQDTATCRYRRFWASAATAKPQRRGCNPNCNGATSLPSWLCNRTGIFEHDYLPPGQFAGS